MTRLLPAALPKLLAALALFGLCSTANFASGQSFRFLHITDTHIAPAARGDALRQLVRDADRMQPRPAFILHSGDATETGSAEEFDAYKRIAAEGQVPHRVAPGNHDVRWSPTGKEGFVRAFEAAYRSFDHEGVHFVQLDSTVPLQHWGHFGREQLLWLDRDLKKLKKGTPVFVTFHHWIGRENPKADDGEELLRVLGPHNVIAVFVGHGHADLEWRANGIPFYMARGLYQGSYHLIDVGAQTAVVSRVRKEDTEPKPLAELPLAPKPFRRVAILWDDAGIALLERRRILAELRVDEKGAHDERVAPAFSIDGGPEIAMKRDERDTESVSFMGEFATTRMSHGAHRLQLRFRAPDGELFTREESFVVERLDGIQRRWEKPFLASDSILSGVTLGEDLIFAGTLDGTVVAIEPTRGRRKWSSDLPGPVRASPTYADGTLYVASMDHFVYAFEAKSGKLRWKFDAGSLLFAPPAVLGETVCVPGNRLVFGLNARSGKPLWKTATGGFFQARPAVIDGTFVVGGWDNTLYCFDAATGAVRWSSQMGRSDGGRGQLLFYFSPAITSPAAGEGRAFVCTNDGVLHAVDLKTGMDIWTARAPEGGDTFGYSSPLLVNGRIYLGGLGDKNRGDLYCLEADTGKLVWRCSTGADNYDSSPVMQGPNVVIGAVEGMVSWVDAATGMLKFQHRLDPGYCFATPAASERTVFMSSLNGSITALELPS